MENVIESRYQKTRSWVIFFEKTKQWELSSSNICKSCSLFYSKAFRTITEQTINFQLSNSKLNE